MTISTLGRTDLRLRCYGNQNVVECAARFAQASSELDDEIGSTRTDSDA